MAAHAHNTAFDDFERIYDLRLVWPPEIPQRGLVEGGARELGNRFLRVLLSGAGEPHWLLRIQCGAIENNAGGNYAFRVLRFFRLLFGRTAEMELPRGIRVHLPGSLLHFPQMVGTVLFQGRTISVLRALPSPWLQPQEAAVRSRIWM